MDENRKWDMATSYQRVSVRTWRKDSGQCCHYYLIPGLSQRRLWPYISNLSLVAQNGWSVLWPFIPILFFVAFLFLQAFNLPSLVVHILSFNQHHWAALFLVDPYCLNIYGRHRIALAKLEKVHIRAYLSWLS